MKKYTFGICGAFDFEENATGGQSIKTREFYYALSDKLGREKICILESTDYKKNPLCFFISLIRLIRDCENIILFPAQNGILIFAPICKVLKKIYNTKTYYGVIGGWLAKLIDEHPSLKTFLRDFNAILVETNIMKSELAERGIFNTVKLKNFKRLKPIKNTEIKEVNSIVRLCYFSRVTKLKGIADAVDVVNKINKNGIQCTLDIFGPVTDGYNKEFEALQKTFNKWIVYKGKINPADSISVISDYDIQLFPTHYKTEGIPGSIIDSYFAGVPVIASKWNSFSDLIIEGETGIGYEINHIDDFFDKLNKVIHDKEKIMYMKQRALQEARSYQAERVIDEFLQIVGR